MAGAAVSIWRVTPWLLAMCWAGSALACGGATEREHPVVSDAGAPAASPACRQQECAGRLCEAADTCSDAALYLKGCLPEACGLPSVCRYQQVTAAAAWRKLVCSCAGVAEVALVGASPTVFAYAFFHQFYDCSPGYDEVCELSTLVGAACDPALTAAPELLPVVAGTGLPFHDGVALLALDVGRSEPLLGSGTVEGGAVGFLLETSPGASLIFLADENGDGACSAGERILRHARQLVPLEGVLRYAPVAEAELIPCERRLSR